MRTLASLLMVLILSGTAWSQAPQRPVAPKGPATLNPKSANPADASYAIGWRIGSNFKRQHVPVEAAALIKGVQEGLAGTKPSMSEEEMDEVLKLFQQEVAALIPEQNKKDGEAFCAKNAKTPGVKTTKSGLQYKVLKEGTGKIPKATDTVTAHYRGTLLDGSPFDSSYDRGEPLKIAVSGVIPGWTEALQMMKVGSKWQLVIPADLAYGPAGSPPFIGPNSTLIFDIELLGIGDE